MVEGVEGAEGLVDFLKGGELVLALGRVGEEEAEFIGDADGGGVVLDEFGDDEAVEEDVGKGDVVEFGFADEEFEVGGFGSAVHDDAGALTEGGFEGGGSGADDGGAGGFEDGVGVGGVLGGEGAEFGPGGLEVGLVEAAGDGEGDLGRGREFGEGLGDDGEVVGDLVHAGAGEDGNASRVLGRGRGLGDHLLEGVAEEVGRGSHLVEEVGGPGEGGYDLVGDGGEVGALLGFSPGAGGDEVENFPA